MYKILLCCASGVTTNMLVASIKKSAEEQNETIMCWAAGAKAMPYSWPDADCLLVAPQSRSELPALKEMIQDTIPVEMIDEQAFINMDGASILKQAIELISK